MTGAEIDAFDRMNLSEGTQEIAGHSFSVALRGARKTYCVDGLRVDRDVFFAILETAQRTARTAAL